MEVRWWSSLTLVAKERWQLHTSWLLLARWIDLMEFNSNRWYHIHYGPSYTSFCSIFKTTTRRQRYRNRLQLMGFIYTQVDYHGWVERRVWVDVSLWCKQISIWYADIPMEYSSYKYSLNWIDVVSIKVNVLDTFINLAYETSVIYRNVVALWGGLYPYAFGNVGNAAILSTLWDFVCIASIMICWWLLVELWVPLVQSRVALAASGLLCSTAVVWTATKHMHISKESVWLLDLIIMNICFIGLVFVECGLSSLVASRKLKDGKTAPKWLVLLIDISLIPDHIHFSFLNPEEEESSTIMRNSSNNDMNTTRSPNWTPHLRTSTTSQAGQLSSKYTWWKQYGRKSTRSHSNHQSVAKRRSSTTTITTPHSIALGEDEAQEEHVQMRPIYTSKSFNVEYRMSRHPDEHYTYAKGGAAVSRIYRYVLPVVYAATLTAYLSRVSQDRANLPAWFR